MPHVLQASSRHSLPLHGFLLDSLKALALRIAECFSDGESPPPGKRSRSRRGRGKGVGDADLPRIQLSLALLARILATEMLSEKLPDQTLSVREAIEQAVVGAAKLAGLSQPVEKYIKRVTQLLASPASDQVSQLHQNVLRAKEGPGFPLGEAYAALIPAPMRRQLGQFWTPPHVAEFMVRWVLRTPEDHLLDPAVGPGVFLHFAAQLLRSWGVSPRSVAHQLAGFEVHPTTYLMGLCTVLPHTAGHGPRLRLGDFLGGAPDKRFDAVVCNPPYTRHHHLPETYKTIIRKDLEAAHAVSISRFSSLFVYFFLHALRFLRPGGRMAFITPSGVYEAGYSRAVKGCTGRALAIRGLVVFEDSLQVFPGVDAAACITLLEKTLPEPDSAFNLVRVREWPGWEEVLNAVAAPEARRQSWGSVNRIRQAGLQASAKWSILDRPRESTPPGHQPLRDLARVMRGVATGRNEFFVLTPEKAKKLQIESQLITPVITRNRDVPGYVLTKDHLKAVARQGRGTLLLSIKPKTDLSQYPRARSYLRQGKALGVDQGVLVGLRGRWFEMENRKPAPIVFTYLSRRRTRFILNRMRAINLTTFLSIYPQAAIVSDEVRLRAFVAILNSPSVVRRLRQYGRSYGGDTLKLEPRELDAVPVLDPLLLTVKEAKHLARLFDVLCGAEGQQEAVVLGKIEERLRQIQDRLRQSPPRILPREKAPAQLSLSLE